MKKLPNLFIVGVGKSGTTSLYQYLKFHPDIYMSPLKEPHFLADKQKLKEHFDIDFSQVITNEEQYFSLFQKAKNEKILGEASTSYLYYVEPEVIKKKFPNSKIIIMLRNPVERAWSHYLMAIRDGFINPNTPFSKAIEDFPIIVKLGFYSKNVRKYIESFQNDIYVILFDEFKKNTQTIIKCVYRFLEVDSTFSPEIKTYNASAIPTSVFSFYLLKMNRKFKLYKFVPKFVRKKIKPLLLKNMKKEMPQRDKYFLLELYKKDIIELSKIINKDVSYWLEI